MKPLTISELIEELKRHPDQNANVEVSMQFSRWEYGTVVETVEEGNVVNVKLAVNSVILEAE